MLIRTISQRARATASVRSLSSVAIGNTLDSDFERDFPKLDSASTHTSAGTISATSKTVALFGGNSGKKQNIYFYR